MWKFTDYKIIIYALKNSPALLIKRNADFNDNNNNNNNNKKKKKKKKKKIKL